MTILFSGGTSNYLVMANDSAVINDFSSGDREFTTGRKFVAIDDVGVVSMWGDRVGNNLITHLDSSAVRANLRDVEDLARTVQRYLTEIYIPHAEPPSDDVGYHVGGFTTKGEVRLFHIYWNAGSAERKHWGTYRIEHHHIPAGATVGYLFNGRHDIVGTLLQTLIAEIFRDPRNNDFAVTPLGTCRLARFIFSTGAMMTREVAPPFVIHVIAPSRRHVVLEVIPSPLEETGWFERLSAVGLLATS